MGAPRLLTESAVKSWVPTKRVNDDIMRDTNIVFYSVILDKNVSGEPEHYIKIGGNRVTLRYAEDTINNIINERVEGLYLTTYKIALPNRITDTWRVSGYSKLNEYKLDYGLKSINIG